MQLQRVKYEESDYLEISIRNHVSSMAKGQKDQVSVDKFLPGSFSITRCCSYSSIFQQSRLWTSFLKTIIFLQRHCDVGYSINAPMIKSNRWSPPIHLHSSKYDWLSEPGGWGRETRVPSVNQKARENTELSQATLRLPFSWQPLLSHIWSWIQALIVPIPHQYF